MPLQIIRTPATVAARCRRAGSPVVLVPTMGALHAGHAALIRRARKLAGSEGTVVVSAFVNPTQFGPKEDFSRYPRNPAADRALCEENGADFIFAPSVDGMYAADASIAIEETQLSTGLCGASRPGHFRGVCTVVAKLFLIAAPDIAVFGEKDYQQLAVIRRLVRDLNFPVRIVGVETVREADGLALSSRNLLLDSEQRRQAPVINRALRNARKIARTGTESSAKLRAGIVREIGKASGARIDYVEIVHPDTLAPVRKTAGGAVAAVAVFFGKTRLIDNIVLSPSSKKSS